VGIPVSANNDLGVMQKMADRQAIQDGRCTSPTISCSNQNANYDSAMRRENSIEPFTGGETAAVTYVAGGGILRAVKSAWGAVFGGAAVGAEAAAVAEMSPLLQRYLAGSGGRWGSAATRQQNHDLASALESSGYTIRGGAGRASEEWFAGAGGGTRGGTFVDITATKAGEPTLRIQTISTLRDGVTPTAAEAAAAARIQARFPNDTLLLIPKR
jgi:hypothetical protein